MAATARGFTLIEMMIVVAIIALLSAIGLPAYQDYLVRSQISEGLVLATAAKTAVWDFTAQYGRLPPGNASAGLPSATSISGKFVSAVSISTGIVVVTYAGARVNQALANGKLALVPTFDSGGLRWNCQLQSGINPRFLPTSCRP